MAASQLKKFSVLVWDHEAASSSLATRIMRSVLIGFENPIKDTPLFSLKSHSAICVEAAETIRIVLTGGNYCDSIEAQTIAIVQLNERIG